MPGQTRTNRASAAGFMNGIIAVSTTVAAAMLLSFFGVVKDLAEQAPLITQHMQVTNTKLASIEQEQIVQSKAMAALLKDYTSREELQKELEKVSSEIRNLQLRQAVIEQILKTVEARG